MTTVVQTAPGGAVVVDSTPEGPSNKCCHYATAILSFLTGGGTFILGIVAIAALPNDKTSWAKNSATGIWCGGIVAFTGMLGVASTWKFQNKVLRGFYIFFGVISTILCFVAIIIFIIATLWYAVTLSCKLGTWSAGTSCDKKDLAVGLHVTMMIFCGFEFIVAIVGSCLACNCCCGNNSRTVVVAPQPVAMQQQGYPNQGYQQGPPPQYPPQQTKPEV